VHQLHNLYLRKATRVLQASVKRKNTLNPLKF